MGSFDGHAMRGVAAAARDDAVDNEFIVRRGKRTERREKQISGGRPA